MADVNRDGLFDVVYPSNDAIDNVRVLLSTGKGFMPDSRFGTRAKPMRIMESEDFLSPIGFLMTDFNGDGADDFVYIDADTDSVQVMMSSGSDEPVETTWAWLGTAGTLTAADLEGDGLPDVASYTRSGSEMQIDLLRGGLPGAGGQAAFPDLLSKVQNGIGGSYSLTYKPSSAYVNTYLPHIVQTVSSVTASDGTNTYITELTYEGGLHSYKEREFRGFAKVVRKLPDQSTVTTWLKQDDIYKGLITQQTTKESDGRLFKDVKSTYKNTQLGIPLGTANFPHLFNKKEDVYDGMPTPMTMDTIFDPYDSYGNLIKKTVTDSVSGAKRIEGSSYWSYADMGNWIV